MTPISYDFVRANSPTVHSKLAGFTTETWGYSVNSELLPGFDFSSSYSLFQGSPLSDTAKFKPYLTSISASFNISRAQNPFVVLARLLPPRRPRRRRRRRRIRPVDPNPTTRKLAHSRQPVRAARGRAIGSSFRRRTDGARRSTSTDRVRVRRLAPT